MYLKLAAMVAGALISTGTTKLEITQQRNLSKKGLSVSTYRGGHYCGPGWGFTYQDILDGHIRELPDAIDAIDEACKSHDYCYHEHGYFTQGCNLVLTYDLVEVVKAPGSTAQQRLDAAIMAAVFFIESQLIDTGKLAATEAKAIAERLHGRITAAGATMQQAILRELQAPR